MSTTNHCQFLGNLTKDPEGRDTNSGENSRVVNFSLAINTYRKKGEDAPPTYVDFEVWGTAAETLERLAVKGDRLLVHAEYKTNVKETDEGKRYFHKFRVSNFEFIKLKAWDNKDGDQAEDEEKPAKTKKTKKPTKPAADDVAEGDIDF